MIALIHSTQSPQAPQANAALISHLEEGGVSRPGPPGPVSNERLLGPDGQPLPGLLLNRDYRGVNRLVCAYVCRSAW